MSDSIPAWYAETIERLAKLETKMDLIAWLAGASAVAGLGGLVGFVIFFITGHRLA